MTKDEIKSTVSMKDVLARYGLQTNRAGFIRCPFHGGDREASMKIYQKDFHCFGCGANGDQIDFVRRMEGCSFKDAFLFLGGTYGKQRDDFSYRLEEYRRKKSLAMRRKQVEKARNERRLSVLLITIYRRYLDKSEPLSDAWCDCYNAMQMQLLKIMDDR